MNKLTKDISILTTIPEFTLDKLVNLTIKCISHNIVESIRCKKDVSEIDIGIGTLLVTYLDDDLKFKFIPSSALQSSIHKTYEKGDSELVISVEDILSDKITNTYKNLL